MSGGIIEDEVNRERIEDEMNRGRLRGEAASEPWKTCA